MTFTTSPSREISSINCRKPQDGSNITQKGCCDQSILQYSIWISIYEYILKLSPFLKFLDTSASCSKKICTKEIFCHRLRERRMYGWTNDAYELIMHDSTGGLNLLPQYTCNYGKISFYKH